MLDGGWPRYVKQSDTSALKNAIVDNVFSQCTRECFELDIQRLDGNCPNNNGWCSETSRLFVRCTVMNRHMSQLYTNACVLAKTKTQQQHRQRKSARGNKSMAGAAAL